MKIKSLPGTVDLAQHPGELTRATVGAEPATNYGSSAAGAAVASDAGLAPLVAVIGCDGSGKSTLAADIRAALTPHRAAAACYLGLGSGELGNRIRRLPLVGHAAEQALSRKATQTRSREQRIPGPATALVVFGFSLLRQRRFARVMALRRRGVVVITDRYPQIEVPGLYDGPGLSAARAEGRFVAWLATRERRMYAAMARHMPTIVLRLNVDVATAHARKPDHKIDLLREKVRVTPTLRFSGAPIVEIDACEPYPDVLRSALRAIEQALGAADRAAGLAA